MPGLRTVNGRAFSSQKYFLISVQNQKTQRNSSFPFKAEKRKELKYMYMHDRTAMKKAMHALSLWLQNIALRCMRLFTAILRCWSVVIGERGSTFKTKLRKEVEPVRSLLLRSDSYSLCILSHGNKVIE